MCLVKENCRLDKEAASERGQRSPRRQLSVRLVQAGGVDARAVAKAARGCVPPGPPRQQQWSRSSPRSLPAAARSRSGQGHVGGMTAALADTGTTAPFTLEAPLTHAAIIFSMAVLIIITNVIIIATFINARGRGEVMNCYVVSLSVADLLCGVLVVPLSVYPALVEQWVYGDLVCRLVGYVQVTLWAVTVYTFMWISVDRYLAVRKPLRYETVQTKTRCQCWMAFTWISAAMMCCPPLLGFNQPLFDHDALICMLDWKDMAAYATTLAILILGPSLITVVYTYGYIFGMMRRLRQGAPIHDKEYATALSENLANPSHVMSFVLVFTFWLAWLPFIVLRLYEHWSGHRINLAHLHFAVFWLGILNSTLKFLVLVLLSPQFRLMLRCLCLSLCCRTSKSRLLQMQLIGMDADD